MSSMCCRALYGPASPTLTYTATGWSPALPVPVSVAIDVGYYVTIDASKICLARPKPNVNFPGGSVSEYLLLSSYQRTSMEETFSAFQYVARDESAQVKKLRYVRHLCMCLSPLGGRWHTPPSWRQWGIWRQGWQSKCTCCGWATANGIHGSLWLP